MQIFDLCFYFKKFLFSFESMNTVKFSIIISKIFTIFCIYAIELKNLKRVIIVSEEEKTTKTQESI